MVEAATAATAATAAIAAEAAIAVLREAAGLVTLSPSKPRLADACFLARWNFV